MASHAWLKPFANGLGTSEGCEGLGGRIQGLSRSGHHRNAASLVGRGTACIARSASVCVPLCKRLNEKGLLNESAAALLIRQLLEALQVVRK